MGFDDHVECDGFAEGVNTAGTLVDGDDAGLVGRAVTVVVGGIRVAKVVDEEIGVLPLGDVVVLDVCQHGLSGGREACAPKAVGGEPAVGETDLVGSVRLPEVQEGGVVVHLLAEVDVIVFVHNKKFFDVLVRVPVLSVGG